MDNQTQAWASQFGVDYTDRNMMTTKEMDELYLKLYGVSRTEMNREFLNGIHRDIRILEVGSNVGLQLMFLQEMGFRNLYGIEISSYAVELSKQKTKDINIIWGNALDIPFKDKWFDMVFTSGVLIHINPNDLVVAMKEIYRCSSRYIWGFEYFADKLTQVKYREAAQTSDLLWKDNFPKLYRSCCDLAVKKMVKYRLLNEPYEDCMFLLEKI